jgi:hypothetical protein
MKRLLVVGFSIVVLVLAVAACGGNPSGVEPAAELLQATPGITVQNTTSDAEETQLIPLYNCDGKAEYKRTEVRSQSIEAQISAELAAQIGVSAEVAHAAVQAAVGGALTSGSARGTSIELVAPPGTNMEIQLVWKGDEQVGVVQNILGSDVPIAFRSFSPIDVRVKSQYDIGCPTPKPISVEAASTSSSQAESEITTSPAPSTIAPAPTDTPVQPPPYGITAGQLDGLFGSGNWFCFPDRTNGIGVKSLPVNFTVAEPLRYVDTFRGRYEMDEMEPGATGATVELISALPAGQCPGWQQEALTSWVAARSTGSQIGSAAQLDSILGHGNWACLPDYGFGAKVYFFSSDLRIEYPFTTVDISDGTKHGVGETVNPNGEMTVWFAGSVPRGECP